jgi:hypothetical protein
MVILFFFLIKVVGVGGSSAPVVVVREHGWPVRRIYTSLSVLA